MPSSRRIRKPKLSVEEKKAIKEEKKRLLILKIENYKKQEYQNHLLREQKFREITLEKVSKYFENLCASIKLPEAKTELKEAIEGLQNALDLREHIINRFLQDRKIADEQYRRNVFKHSEMLQYIIRLHKLFTKILKDKYESDVYAMLYNFYRERHFQNEIVQNRQSYYENIFFATNLTTKNELGRKKTEFLAQNNEFNEKNIEIKYKLRDDVIVKMQKLHSQMDDFVRVTRENFGTEIKLKTYNILHDKNEKSQKLFQQIEQEARKHHKTILKLQQELTYTELNFSQTFSDLKHERRVCKRNFDVLNKLFKENVSKDAEQLKVLACNTHDSIKVCNLYFLIISM